VWRRSDFARLSALDPAERRVLLAAIFLLLSYASRVRLFGLRATQARMRRLAAAESAVPPQRIAAIVAAAARRMPVGGGCLPSSLALQHLLAASGIASDLRLGVSVARGRLEAHAWVECDGTTLLDTRDPRHDFHAFERAIAPPAT